jgi:Tol biopolymer transport system component
MSAPSRWLAELKRRKVMRAAFVYAAAAFAILQAADLLASGLRLPQWVFPSITVLIVLGLPITLVLAWTFDVTSGGVQRAAGAARGSAPAWLGRGTLLGGGVLLGLGAVLASGWIAGARPAPHASADGEPHASRVYVSATLISERVDVRMVADRFAVAPDGSAVVLVGMDAAGRRGLLLRRRGQIEPVLIAGASEDSHSPVFSPDGRWLAYMESGGLMKLELPDGKPIRIATVAGHRMTWGRDDRLRTTSGGVVRASRELLSIHASTGAVDTLSFGGDTLILRGEWLPRGRLLLSLLVADTLERIAVRERDGRLREIAHGFDARMSAAGHIVFVRREGNRSALVGGMLNRRSAALAGELVTLHRDVPAIRSTPAVPTVHGDVAYLSGLDRAERRIVLLDRQGLEREIAGAERPWVGAIPSHDGSLLATTVWQGGGRQIWTVAVATGAMTPVTRSGDTFGPIWLADTRHIAYINIGDQSVNGGSIMRARADGSAPAEPLMAHHNAYTQYASADGRHLIFSAVGRSYVVSTDPDSTPRPLLPPGLGERRITLSPDSRWLAFAMVAGGRREVRIAPFADPAASVAVSRADPEPVGWSRDGRFFYRTGLDVWELPVGDDGPTEAAARPAFRLPGDVAAPIWVMPDGARLVLIRGGNLQSDLLMIEDALRGRRHE